MMKTGTTNSTRSRWSKFAGCSSSDITPVIEFTAELQSNNLTYHQPYSKRQEIILNLIEYLHDDKEWDYRVIARKMNSWGIKTHRGKTWSNSSVHSVLKRMHERDVRIEGVRNKKYPIKISKMVVRFHTV